MFFWAAKIFFWGLYFFWGKKAIWRAILERGGLPGPISDDSNTDDDGLTGQYGPGYRLLRQETAILYCFCVII